MIRDDPSRSELIRPGLAVRVDPVRLLYLPENNWILQDSSHQILVDIFFLKCDWLTNANKYTFPIGKIIICPWPICITTSSMNKCIYLYFKLSLTSSVLWSIATLILMWKLESVPWMCMNPLYFEICVILKIFSHISMWFTQIWSWPDVQCLLHCTGRNLTFIVLKYSSWLIICKGNNMKGHLPWKVYTVL